MNITSSSSEVRALAAKGLAAVAALPTQEQQYTTHDQYLAAVAGQASATPAERLIASTLRACTSQSLKYPTALNAQRAALQVLAGGVGGPLGPALASLGLTVSRGAYNQEDQYVVDAPFLRSISKEGAPLEREVAAAALTVTSQALKYPTAVSAQQHALTMVAGTLTGSAQKVVADYGQAAMRSAYNQEDQHAVAQQVLPLLRRAAGTPVGTAVAEVACDLMTNSMKYTTAIAAEMHALQMIAAPPSTDVDIARASYGVNAMRTAYNQEDQYLVGNVVLKSLALGAASPVSKSIAQAARAALTTGMKYSSAVGFQSLVLGRLASGPAAMEKTLAETGRQLSGIAYNQEDQYTLGLALVTHLETNSTDPQVKALAHYCRQVCGVQGVTYAQALQAQQAVFDGIVTGNMSVPATITAGGSSTARVVLPTIDPSAPAEEQKAALEAAILKNKQNVRAVEDDQAKVSAEIVAAQQRLQEIHDAAKTLETREAPLIKRFNQLGRIGGLAGLAAAGGMLVTAATGSPISLVVGIVGAAACIGTQVLRGRTRQKLYQLRADAEQSTWEVLHLQAQIQIAGSRGAELRKAQAQIEKVIADAQGRLDTLRMATAPKVEGDTTVRMEDDFVVVGGLKIPRNNATKPQEQPTA